MVKEEKKSLESDGNGLEDDQNHDQPNNKEEGRGVKDERTGSKPNSPNRKDIIAKQVSLVNMNERSMEIDAENQQSCVQENEEEQLKLARAEMDEVREENERLKSVLGQLVKDYQSLHVHFLQVLEQEASKKIKSTASNDSLPASTAPYDEEPELVSLSLGTARPTEPRKKKQTNGHDRKDQDQGDEILNERLKLGLDCRFDDVGDKSPENKKNTTVEDHDHGMEEHGKEQEEPNVETWPPSKFPKTARSGGDQDDEVLQQSHLKKPRVSIRARCDTPTMNDGCQWRKYGQKIAKGNPCPRAYYRCTISPTCPVRKQVQRCADDMSVLITTYEGNHNHPLPISATAMASTTSAAAAMLTSRSSSSSSSLGTASANLHGLNFTLPYNNLSSSSSSSSRSPQNNLYFPHSTITTSNSHPTITLDLTAQTTFSNFNTNRLSSTTRPSPSCLSFSNNNSSSSTFSDAFHHTPYVHPNNFFSYGSGIPNFNRPTNNLGNIGLRQQNPDQGQFYNQQYGPIGIGIGQNNPTLTDTIAAATKAITSNPTFRSALTAALTSYVGSGAQESRVAGAPASVSGGFPFGQTGSTVGCGSSFLSKSPGLGNAHQQGSLVLFPPPVRQVSGSKSGSGSPPGDNKVDHAK